MDIAEQDIVSQTQDAPSARPSILWRSRVWKCATCGKLSGTEEAAPAPMRCAACAGVRFEQFADRRRNR